MRDLFAWEYVNIYGCDVKMFCFSRANPAITILKNFLNFSIFSILLYSPIPSSTKTRKIFTKHAVSIFFSLNEADIRSLESYLFPNQELITRAC